MTVIHTNGIHQIRYRYCNCTRAHTLGDNNNLSQLLRGRWYPATVTDPTTCASFNVLDLFRLLNVVGNVNCHDFIGSLERMTDAAGSTGMNWMPVCAKFWDSPAVNSSHFAGSLQTIRKNVSPICVLAEVQAGRPSSRPGWRRCNKAG
jgi:hypothetical protein